MDDTAFDRAMSGASFKNIARFVSTSVGKSVAQQRRTLIVLLVATVTIGLLYHSSRSSYNVVPSSGREVDTNIPVDETFPPVLFGLGDPTESPTTEGPNFQTTPPELATSEPDKSLDAADDADSYSDAKSDSDSHSDSESLEESDESSPDSDVDFGSDAEGEYTTPFGFSTPETTEGPSADQEPTWEASYNATEYYLERKKTSCYLPANPVYYFSKPVVTPEFEEKDCQKRLPKVVIAGVRKCGTGTLMRFLNMHPNVAVTNYEIHYFDNNYEHRGDVEWYRDQMQYSTPLQVPMEKTPTYFFRPYDAPMQIRKTLSKDVKIIVILCDPINRAVSDYLEFARKYRKTELDNIYSRKYLASTFEESVINNQQEVQVYNEIVDAGIYVKYVHRWMEYFPLKQLLFVDGEKFKVNPTAELRRVEKFVGLKPFFRKEHFFLDDTKGFYCANYPQPSCMNSSKGREHPEVDPKVLKTLCKFYTPYDKALENTLKQKFSWVGKC